MNQQNASSAKVWLVTGASKGLGLTLAKALLQAGYRVAATTRNLDDLVKAVGKSSSTFLPLAVDLLSEGSIAKAVDSTIKNFGQIDVLVNNAGYGQFGTIEEVSDKEARQNFDVNVFAMLNVIRAVLPHMRRRGKGQVFNISSIGGFLSSYSGWGVYCATKFAVAGLTEALNADVKPLGIHATVVYPGYFRTDFLSKESMVPPAQPIKEYQAARKSQDYHATSMNGQQAGDPEKAAAALIEVANAATPPLHLFLGSDAYGGAQGKLEALKKDLAAWQTLSTATDYKA